MLDHPYDPMLIMFLFDALCDEPDEESEDTPDLVETDDEWSDPYDTFSEELSSDEEPEY